MLKAIRLRTSRAISRVCDGSVLSKFEGRIIAAYRAMDTAGKQMIRTLFDRLTATTPCDQSEHDRRAIEKGDA